MRVLVCGDRHWDEPMVILARLRLLPTATVVIHGAAPGADTFGGQIADALGFGVEPYPAEWSRHENCRCPADAPYCGAAGPRRNKQMLAAGPDLVLAFHADIERSKGTKHMVTIARKAEVPVEIITGTEEPEWEE